MLTLEGDIERIHDPVIIKEKDTYYVFCTGRLPGATGTIPIRRSKDLRKWTLSGTVFDKLPDWALKAVPGARDAWAPDISFFSGKYHLYYSVSTFGRNRSAIGLATTPTLDPASPEYRWTDQGMVIESTPGADDWNAIDPNLVIEKKDKLWLTWGSFWGGIKMRRIDPATGKASDKDTTLYSLCSRPRSAPGVAPGVPGAVEAPFIVRHGKYWYLFVSYDFCCRGAKSDYYVVAGRSKEITGPYAGKDGRPLISGGGTLVVPPRSSKWNGAGHQAVLRERNTDYLLFHAYDPTTGRPSLRISTMVWDGGWPRVAAAP
jgi:arabinan endo-1,5-alpha-L-arabinosidase